VLVVLILASVYQREFCWKTVARGRQLLGWQPLSEAATRRRRSDASAKVLLL